MVVLPFPEDLSDREMERFIRENLAAKWFCWFGLSERRPDHSFFGDFRKRLGTGRQMDLFNRLRGGLKRPSDRQRSGEVRQQDSGDPGTDAQALRHIGTHGAVFGDKGYCTKPARTTLARKGCFDATIRKRNMAGKNVDEDRRLSGLRAPYERVFSKRPARLRSRGLAKSQFQVAMQAISHNLKRVVRLGRVCPHPEISLKKPKFRPKQTLTDPSGERKQTKRPRKAFAHRADMERRSGGVMGMS